MDLEPTKNLKDVENSLQDLIFVILTEKYGDKWEENIGVTEDRITKWKERKEEEKKRQQSGTIEERLMYYSDFYDLKTILINKWELFSSIFIDKKTIETFLNQLEKYRDPDAHRRDLFSYQKMLIAGMSGEIRSLITKYHSKKETCNDCFSRIESIRDNFGNSYTIGGSRFCDSKMILRPGDKLEFVVAASDPELLDLEYNISTHPGTWSDYASTKWQKYNTLQCNITEKNISKMFSVKISIKSPRDYHARSGEDDFVEFLYTVLPN